MSDEPVPGGLPADPIADPAGAVVDETLADELADAALDTSGFGRGARLLSIGIAATGLLTFLFFATASHALSTEEYGAVSTMWAILFVAMCVMYRPVEQLLSRTIATAHARGDRDPSLREPLLIQAGFAAVMLAAALIARGPLTERLHSEALFWILTVAALAYAASYFARGFVAGHQWFGLYGGLVLFESLARILFPIAVLVGIASGQTMVALGIAAAPIASLTVVPWAIINVRRRGAGSAAVSSASKAKRDGALKAGGGFAFAVALIQLGEQTLVNAGTLLTADRALAGAIFSALMVTRAPLQLFQAVQTSLLPHLSKLDVTSDGEAFSRAIRITVLAIVGFAAVVALGLLAIGPWAMTIVFGDGYEYGRVGLAVVGVGMGAHLAAGTLNQAALARGNAAGAAAAWLVAAGLFVVWMLLDVMADPLERAEFGYCGATFVLCGLLYLIYRRPAGRADPAAA